MNHSRRKWLLITIAILLACSGAAVIYLRHRSPFNRAWVIAALQRRYGGQVQLGDFNARLWPRLEIEGKGLVLSRPDTPGAPPLATASRFTAEANWGELLEHPPRVKRVQLFDLVVNIPPHRPQPPVPAAPGKSKRTRAARPSLPFVMDSIIADGAFINVLSANPQKPPHVIAVSSLHLRSIRAGQPMGFEALLTNNKPLGTIHTQGSFGPWDSTDPGSTPLSGTYHFDRADLSTIRGLEGTLASVGQYDGVLQAIRVTGTTSTPAFGLGFSPNREALNTRFTATVDGQSGDTILDSIQARLGDSALQAHGAVVREGKGKGELVRLQISAHDARIEDVLRLSVSGDKMPLQGGMDLNAQLDVPPGKQAVPERMQLKGRISVHRGQFSDPRIEDELLKLSHRAQGHPKDVGGSAPFELNGDFTLDRGVTTFSQLGFGVPGAEVRLHGSYDLTSEQLDFRGAVLLQVALSKTTSGVKSLLLRVVNPLVRGPDAPTEIPIRVDGVRESPAFHAELGDILHHRLP